MRDYTRKAKRIDNGEWVEGYLFFIADTPYIICDGEEMCMDGENADLYATEWYTVDENTICEPTGLTDMNDNKIWENDIIKEHCNGLVGRLIWDMSTATYKLEGFSNDYKIEDARIEWEVIGNVFDRPDLLKEDFDYDDTFERT